MSSSVVAYDRPLISRDITKTYLPTHVIARAINEINLSCVNLETNSSLEVSANLDQYKLLVLTGHDEYWTDNYRKNIDNFVKSGNSLAVFSGNTNFRRIVLKNNSVWRDKNTDEFNPTENSIGLACRFGCEPVTDIAQLDKLENKNIYFTNKGHLRGMKVIEHQHPIFQNTNLKNNDFFGRDSKLIWYEIDGAPLDPITEKIDIEILPKASPSYDGLNIHNKSFEAKKVIPLAATYLKYFNRNEPQYAATFVEFHSGDGVVLNGGSVGWFRVLETDTKAKLIFSNAIRYLFESHNKVAR
jgi:hypothetical protein